MNYSFHPAAEAEPPATPAVLDGQDRIIVERMKLQRDLLRFEFFTDGLGGQFESLAAALKDICRPRPR